MEVGVFTTPSTSTSNGAQQGVAIRVVQQVEAWLPALPGPAASFGLANAAGFTMKNEYSAFARVTTHQQEPFSKSTVVGVTNNAPPLSTADADSAPVGRPTPENSAGNRPANTPREEGSGGGGSGNSSSDEDGPGGERRATTSSPSPLHGLQQRITKGRRSMRPRSFHRVAATATISAIAQQQQQQQQQQHRQEEEEEQQEEEGGDNEEEEEEAPQAAQ